MEKKQILVCVKIRKPKPLSVLLRDRRNFNYPMNHVSLPSLHLPLELVEKYQMGDEEAIEEMKHELLVRGYPSGETLVLARAYGGGRQPKLRRRKKREREGFHTIGEVRL